MAQKIYVALIKVLEAERVDFLDKFVAGFISEEQIIQVVFIVTDFVLILQGAHISLVVTKLYKTLYQYIILLSRLVIVNLF